MRQLFIILTIGTFFLTSCKKQREQLDDFVFDNSQIAYRDVHKYTFDKDGRIKVDRRTSYQYIAGVPLDSAITETIFAYNEKGQLISAVDLPDSTRQIRIYNDLDSLVGDFRINEFGDTTRLALNVYDGNKVVRTKNRYLDMRLPETFEKARKEDLRNYDTMLLISDLIYENDIHVKSLVRDKTGMVSEEIEHYYQDDKIIKTIKHAFFGDAKYIKEITYYPNNAASDFVSIGPQGDTTAFTKTFKRKDGRIVLHYIKGFDIQDMAYYDIDGQLQADVMIDANAQEKTVTKYFYDNKGNKIEEITYRRRLE